jgi:hypothetical protein
MGVLLWFWPSTLQPDNQTKTVSTTQVAKVVLTCTTRLWSATADHDPTHGGLACSETSTKRFGL